jgi:hypothetical protein
MLHNGVDSEVFKEDKDVEEFDKLLEEAKDNEQKSSNPSLFAKFKELLKG